jgi:murein DD-endopeptidase MepM/ murein hydrolase activator NlpD
MSARSDNVRSALILGPAALATILFLAWPRSDSEQSSSGLGDGAAEASSASLDSLIRNAAQLSSTFERISDSIALVMKRVNRLPIAMPTEGLLSSRHANMRLHPVTNRARPHYGIDVAAPMGTNISASGSGQILRVATVGSYGLLVEVDHGEGLITRYAHCSRVTVKVGDQVDRGDKIATVGNSGLTTGPHLHYEIIYKGQPVDPLLFIG